MNNLMQREDFLALTRGAMGFNEAGEPGYYGSQTFLDTASPKYRRWVPVCSSNTQYDQARVLEDWFPAGTIFEFLGTTCFSRGIERRGVYDRDSQPSQVLLRVLAPSAKGGMEEICFTVREALNIAQQISKERVNFLNSNIGADIRQNGQ
jgi:hypothetical protein